MEEFVSRLRTRPNRKGKQPDRCRARQPAAESSPAAALLTDVGLR
jgi:hypothetical protein